MSARALRLLLVEDNPGDALLLRIALEEAQGGPPHLEDTGRLGAALDRLAEERFDALLLDLSLPDAHGLETVTLARQAAPDVPIIVLTGLDDQEVALRAVQEGAQDYLVKGEVTGGLLMRSIRYAIERHRLQAQIEALTLVDDLSGIYNRRGFMTLAEQQLRIAARQARGVALLYADLDGMKQVNDVYGHSEGDRAIVETSRILLSTFRSSDVIARLGGDEFVVLAFDVKAGDAAHLTRRLHEAVRARNARRPDSYPLSISVGVVYAEPGEGWTLQGLLSRADEEMYERKRAKADRTGAALGYGHRLASGTAA